MTTVNDTDVGIVQFKTLDPSVHQVSIAKAPPSFVHIRLVHCSHTLDLPLVLTPRVPANQHYPNQAVYNVKRKVMSNRRTQRQSRVIPC